jgi:hypothetical protein
MKKYGSVQNALARLKGHNFSSGVHSAAFDYLNPYQVGNNVIEQPPVSFLPATSVEDAKRQFLCPGSEG